MCAVGRAQVQKVEYENISLERLITEYREAYQDAGFHFLGRVPLGSDGSVRLSFEIRIPDFPETKNGIASIVIGGRLSENGLCMPCEAHRELLGVRHDDYGYEAGKIAKAESYVFAADERATKTIRKKLGRSLPEMPSR